MKTLKLKDLLGGRYDQVTVSFSYDREEEKDMVVGIAVNSAVAMLGKEAEGPSKELELRELAEKLLA